MKEWHRSVGKVDARSVGKTGRWIAKRLDWAACKISCYVVAYVAVQCIYVAV